MGPNNGEGPDEKDPYDFLDDFLNELELFGRALIKGDGSLFHKDAVLDLRSPLGPISGLEAYNPTDTDYVVDDNEVYLGMILPEEVSHEDIIVDFSDGDLTVTINSELEKEDTSERGVQRTYRSTFSIRHSYQLPIDCITDKATIEYETGFLEIIIPRNPLESKPLDLGDIDAENPLDLDPL